MKVTYQATLTGDSLLFSAKRGWMTFVQPGPRVPLFIEMSDGDYEVRLVSDDFAEWCAEHRVTLTRPPANDDRVVKVWDVKPDDDDAAFEFKLRWM